MLKTFQKKARAFTLLELIVVIVILSILAAIAIPTFSSVTNKSKDAATRVKVAAMLHDTQALVAFNDGTDWSDAMEIAASEADVAYVGSVAAGGLEPKMTDSMEPTLNQAVYRIDRGLTGTSAGTVTLSLRSPSGNVCVGVATLNAASTPVCIDPGTVSASAKTVAGTILSDVSRLPANVAAVPAGVTSSPNGGASGGVSLTVPSLTPTTNGNAVTLAWGVPSGVVASKYTLKNSIGTTLYEGLNTSYTQGSLVAGTTYSYTLTYETSSGATDTKSITYKHMATPAAPTITAGVGSATASFTPVAGATSYTVTSTPGNITATGTSSPITVSGLTNETAYTFKLTAMNETTASTTSAASAPATPSAALKIAATGSLQTFVPQVTGTYKLEAWGAQGVSGSNYASALGGKGAYKYGTATLTAGTTYYLIVGGQSPATAYNAAGGGGTFIYSGTGASANLLLAAGGGGGAGGNSTGGLNGSPGVATENGTLGPYASGAYNGTGGSGGLGGYNYDSGGGGGGGAGWLGAGKVIDGGAASACKPNLGSCAGGTNPYYVAAPYGGAGAGNLANSGGGGGGYSGGAGGWRTYGGGGGGSYAASTLTGVGGADGANSGAGRINITLQ